MVACITKAQQSGFAVTGGIGTYKLSGLKNYQIELTGRMPVDVKNFSNFPAYTSYKINLFKQKTSGIKYGVAFAFSTSGAHANYTDISGYLNLDQSISAYQLNTNASYRMINGNYIDLFATGYMGLSYVRDVTIFNISTYYYYNNNQLVLSAISPFLELGLEGLYNLSKISVGIEGGYLIDAGSKFKVGEESYPESLVSISPSQEIKSAMSGFRMGLKFILWFNTDIIEE